MLFAGTLRSLHWRRGLRAAIAVGMAMAVCRALGQPMGWAALGGFEAVLVDNGGGYRSRLATVAAVLLGGALCGLAGSLVPHPLALAMAITAILCFAVTYARVASQPLASTSVIVLVLYFAGLGSPERTLHAALANVALYVLGGVWAACLSLLLWPIDPFRPARRELAFCYERLATLAALPLEETAAAEQERDADRAAAVARKREIRTALEAARSALSAVAARAPARTVQARNLSVLLETADIFFGLTIRLSELAEVALAPAPATPAGLAGEVQATLRWLAATLAPIAEAIRHRPADAAASFQQGGSYWLASIEPFRARLQPSRAPAAALARNLRDAQQEALTDAGIAFEALRALWTGVESRLPGGVSASILASAPHPDRLEPLRANWTLDSVMMRHALRMAVVGALDVLFMRLLRISHGYWLAMTSIIVLQPYSSGTMRRGLERVAGTVAGAVLAALLTASIHSYLSIGLVITVCAGLTLATYAVNYGWYSFFLTPTFVLLSLPHLHDWRYAGIRILTTALGAFTAMVAMRALWPQSLRLELTRVLASSAAALAAYANATLAFWRTPAAARGSAQRSLLAPARRACGLTSQDAEEALDRALLEPSLRRSQSVLLETDSGLTFTTYARRFTQCLTMLASADPPGDDAESRLRILAGRLTTLLGSRDSRSAGAPAAVLREAASQPASDMLVDQLLDRMERQVGILERAAAAIVP